jgi:hypothetical protein
VIASRWAPGVYGLEIIDEGIEDISNNYRAFCRGPGRSAAGRTTKNVRWSFRSPTPRVRSIRRWGSSPPPGQPDQTGEPPAQPDLAVCVLCRSRTATGRMRMSALPSSGC